MISQADIGSAQVYLIGQLFQAGQCLLLTAWRIESQRFVERDAFRHRGFDQGIQIRVAQVFQHQLNGGRIRADMATDKSVIIVQCIQRRIYVHSHIPA